MVLVIKQAISIRESTILKTGTPIFRWLTQRLFLPYINPYPSLYVRRRTEFMAFFMTILTTDILILDRKTVVILYMEQTTET